MDIDVPHVTASRCAVFVCVVNYHQDAATVAFAERVQAISGSLTHCLIVDNSLTLQDNDTLRCRIEALPNTTLLFPDTNLGYYGGGRFGFEAAQQLSNEAIPSRWFVICNTDIEFPDPEFFHKLNALDTSSHGVVAPDIRQAADRESYKSGVRQNPFMASPPTRSFLERKLMIARHPMLYTLVEVASHLKHRLGGGGESDSGTVNVDRIYAPHGSFTIFSERYFAAGGTLNFGSFLYGEEIFVGQEAARTGVPVRYVPDLALVHIGGETTLRLSNSGRAKFQADSLAWLIGRT